MKKFIIIVLLLIIFLGFAIAYLVSSEKMVLQIPVIIEKKPKITFIMGDAFHRRSADDKWAIAIVGQELHVGDEVKAEKNSFMDIRFHGDMAVRVAENTVMKIDAMTVRKVLLDIYRGSLYGKFEKLFKDYNIKIKTPTTIAAVRGTELGFEAEEDVTTVFSLSGITELYNPQLQDQKVLLSYENKIVVKTNEPPGNPEKLSDKEVLQMRSMMNSIHTEEVLLISDKINFELGSSKILPDSYNELDKIIAILKEKRVRIRIEGHTDIQGTAAFNQALSIRRAESIRLYFISKGLSPDLLETVGYGSSKPIASNTIKEGRAQNRRVEFIIAE